MCPSCRCPAVADSAANCSAKTTELSRPSRLNDLAVKHGCSMDALLELNPSVKASLHSRRPGITRVGGTVLVPTGGPFLPDPAVGLPVGIALSSAVVLATLARGVSTGTSLLFRLLTGIRLEGTASSSSVAAAAAQAESDGPTTRDTLSLVGRLLLPDLPLIAVCCVALVLCAVSFLAVPTSIGGVFDVLQQVVSTAERSEELRGAFFRAVLMLGASLGLAAVSNTVQIYLSTLIGERFSNRRAVPLIFWPGSAVHPRIGAL